MRMDFEDGVLRVENAQGRCWQLINTEKPRLNFDYDALFVSRERALRRLGTNLHPLTENELREVATFIGKQKPPPQRAARGRPQVALPWTYQLRRHAARV